MTTPVVIKYSTKQLLDLKNKPECRICPDFSHLDPETIREIVVKHISPIKTARAILNKLTPETFNKLVCDLAEVIEQLSQEEIPEVSGLVMQKACMDLCFSKLYAKLCYRLREEKKWVISDEKKNTFINTIVEQCRETFNDFLRRSSMPDAIQMFSDIDKKDFRGLIIFISELFNTGIVNATVPFICSFALIAPEHANDITAEMMCKLLSCCGQKMEKIDRRRSEELFSFLKTSRSTKIFSKRIVFLFEDTIVLRENDWAAKYIYQQDTGPTTRIVSEKKHIKSTKYPTSKRGKGKKPNSRSKQRKSKPVVIKKPTLPTLPVLDDQKSERKIKNIYEEYLNIRDKKEVQLCLAEFSQYSNAREITNRFVEEVINECIWKKESDIRSTVELLQYLRNASCVPAAKIATQIAEISDSVSDLRIDIPKIEEVLILLNTLLV